MNKQLFILYIFLFINILSFGQAKCDVKNFYKAIEAESDIKVLTTSGEVEEAEYEGFPISATLKYIKCCLC
jgi:hypothetical protein